MTKLTRDLESNKVCDTYLLSKITLSKDSKPLFTRLRRKPWCVSPWMNARLGYHAIALKATADTASAWFRAEKS